MTNLAENLRATADKHATRVALKLDDVDVDFRTLDSLSRHVAALLRERGVQSGDRVALLMPNVPHMAFIYYGVLRFGAIAVPLNPLLKSREIAYHLQDSGAELVFAWESAAEEAKKGAAAITETGEDPSVITVDTGAFMQDLTSRDPLEILEEKDDEDTAVLLYTSGTTGQAKGAALTHANLARNAEISRDLMSTEAGDVIFGGLPFFHVFGQTCALNAGVLTGATVTLLPRFDPAKALEIIQRDGVTIFEGVPTMYIAMLRDDSVQRTSSSSLRVAVSGGASLPVEVLHEFERVFSADLLEGYGLSETSPIVTFNRRDIERKPGSIGIPVDGVEVRMLDPDGKEVATGEVGELSVRGHCVMKGYWNNDEATQTAIQNGWFRTGDLARYDEDGAIFIVDRKKDVIIRGGFNVFPRDVEEVLYEHDSVAEAAVIGVSDDLLGEEVVAFVAVKDASVLDDEGKKEAVQDELKAFAKERLASYKYPRRVVLVEELPKGPTGKILKRKMRS